MKKTTDGRSHPPAIKRRAMKLYGEGHSSRAVAENCGVPQSTVQRWARKEGITRGIMIDAKAEEMTEMLPPMEDDRLLPVIQVLAEQEKGAEIRKAQQRTSTPAEQYQTMVAAHGMKMLEKVFEAPPSVRNMRDLKTLTEIVSDALGVGGKRGVGGKLAIDLSVLTRPSGQVTVEAEVVEKNEADTEETD